MVDTVAPSVAYVPPPPPVELNAVPHTGALHLDTAAQHASAHLTDLAGEAAHQVTDAALSVLGALSGALLVGRAALLTTRVLASAAVRAAEEQRCLERQEELSAQAAAQWQAAAFTTARANARRTALLARASRSTRTAAGDPPPRPDLPPPLHPVGCRLGAFREELARFEQALANAEAAQAAWEVRSLTDFLDRAADGDDWQDAMRARREGMLRAHLDARTAAAEQQESPRTAPVPGPAGDEADVAAVRDRGADILAALDPQADPTIVELAAEAVRHATRRAAASPHRARTHLREARKFVESANRKARNRRQEEERAAAQLDFLTMEVPEEQDLPARDRQAEQALRRFLDDGVPLAPAQQDLVRQRVTERHTALEALYLRAQCSDVLARLAHDSGGALRTGRTGDGSVRLDWTPEGWDSDHWLRATLSGDTFHVTTLYRAGSEERSPEEKALDDLRCTQALEHLAEFQELARDMGLTVRFQADATGCRPGEPGEQGVTQVRHRGRTDRGTGPRYRSLNPDDPS
jgi:hypothetical protein